MEHILNCEDAADCKAVSRDITNIDRKGWSETTETLCYNGIRAKFTQNEHFIEKLLENGDKTLIEASYDDIWGTGQPLGSRDCLTKNKWKSAGILGHILMRIRNEAQTTASVEDNVKNMDTASLANNEHTELSENTSQ